MARRGITAFLLAAAVAGSNASAAVDCGTTTLPDGQLSDYLKAYAADCISPAVQARISAWGISPEDYAKSVPAWHEIAVEFRRLAQSPAPASGAQPARMPEMYKQLSERARIAGETLAKQLEAGNLDDVSTFASEGWTRSVKGLILLEVKQAGLPALEVDLSLDSDCSEPASALCKHTLAQGKDLMLQWALAQKVAASVSDPTKEKVAAQVAAKDAQWNAYLYRSKPMLPFDFALTDLLDGRWKQSDQYPKGFREPPRTQWFLLHPSVGIEYASAAADGEQLKPVLYVEILGANRWNPRDRWFDLPFLDRLSGVSLVASYTDRVGTDNSGAGVLLTFDNVYSLGITRYGSTTGIFLSLDLANLYRDELKPGYEAFKNDLGRRRPN